MVTGRPSQENCPWSGALIPAMVLIRTDFPAPLSPARAVTWPAGTSRSTLTSAWTAPKLLLMPRKPSSGWLALAATGSASAIDPSVPAIRTLRLADTRGRAGGRRRSDADIGCLGGTVLHHRGRHVLRRDPYWSQVHRLHIGVGLGVLGGRIHQSGGRALAGSQIQSEGGGRLGLQIDGLVDGPALEAGQHVDEANLRRVLPCRRERLGLDLLALQVRDNGVGIVVVGRHDGVHVGMGSELLGEGGLRDCRRPCSRRLTDLGVSAVGEQWVDDAVVTLGEQGRVVVSGVAVHHEDVGVTYAPGLHAVHKTLSDESADFDVVKADIDATGGAALDQAVVVDHLHALRDGIGFDCRTAT